ncbi:MAG: cytochrome c oxidase subunit II [Gemmatimonadaceae bacterium]
MVGKLFAIIVTVITIVSMAIFISHIWWLPPDVSVLGAGIDHQMNETMVTSGVLFVVAQLVLAFFVWRYADNNDQRKIKIFPGGATPMVVGAIILVGAEILALTFVGSKVWASIYVTPADPHSLKIDVQAEQFAYYFRYPGPDGKFGQLHPDLIDESSGNFFGLDPANDTAARDDIVAATLTVPVNTPVLLELHAKDVSHAFYVPELRIQQDFVPGLVIPLHFTATRLTKSEIVCTQLCGLGHYNMRAYLEVMSDSAFKQWLNDQSGQ